ncbi:MAG: citrate/2-methylcitrate synthase [Symbiopectobacterium sp.]|uniref:citrate/2-methylcitrate synthase n=1 Tax=Symbiopectobacterium sp. TaxID=2952789 RepID=UPI0039ECAD27
MKYHHHDLSDYFDIEHIDNPLVLRPQRHHAALCTLDEGLLHTAICRSHVSRIDPVTLQITYRGYDVTTLVDCADFLDVAVLLLTGEVDSISALAFKRLIARYVFQLSELPALPFTHASILTRWTR